MTVAVYCLPSSPSLPSFLALLLPALSAVDTLSIGSTHAKKSNRLKKLKPKPEEKIFTRVLYVIRLFSYGS